MKALLRTRWRLVVALAGLVLISPGCRRVANPHLETREHHGWPFSNYTIENSTEIGSWTNRHAPAFAQFTGMTLRLFVWTNYVPENVLEAFAKATHTRVELICYSSAEEMYDRLTRGEKFDLLLPPGWQLQRLLLEKRLAPLDYQLLPNFKNIGKPFQTNLFDPEMKYSVPYVWSTAGIAYNFDSLDQIPHRWADLLTPGSRAAEQLAGRVSLIPGPVRALSAALIRLGYSPNTTDTNLLAEAENLLETQTKLLHFRFMRDSVVEALAKEDVLMAQVYSSEAARAATKNPRIHFVLPEDGTWLTIDSFVIPADTGANQQALAHAFLNYLLEPTVAAKFVDYSLKACTVLGALAYIKPEIRLGAPYDRPERVDLQEFGRNSDAFRRELWNQLTNRLNIQSSY